MGARPGGRRARNRARHVPDRRLRSGNQNRDTINGPMPADDADSQSMKVRSVEGLRYISGVGRYAARDPGIGDPDEVACLYHVIVIEHEKNVDRNGFRGTKGESVAWLERSQ